MKSSKEIFMEYIDKVSKEWWEALPKEDAYPFHNVHWNLMEESVKWTIYGLYLDHLRRVGFSQKL